MRQAYQPHKGCAVQVARPWSQYPKVTGEEGGAIDVGKRLALLETLEALERVNEQREKRRIRKHITYLALMLTIAWITLGLFDYLRTGNTFLLASSSTTSGPILIIMGYFFGEQLLQKYIHRGP